MNFIYLLICSISSELTSLNDENYKEILNRKGKKPLFLKVWSPWCSHCQTLAPIYFQLSEIKELNSKIEFGEFNCDLYPSQCKKIADNKVPTFFYYDSDLKDKVLYLGDDSIDSFTFFLQKQLNRGVVNITDENERNEIIASSDYGIVYIFSLPLNDPALDIAINLTKSYKQTNKRFFIENNSTITEKSLVAYRSHNCYVKYEGNWSSSSIFDFIFDNFYPLIENVGPEVLMLSSFFQKQVVLIGISDKQTREELNSWNLEPRPDIQYCVENISQPSVMSYKLLYNLNSRKNYIAVINFTNKVSWKNNRIEFSKHGVDQLINLSLTDKEFKYAYGPGNPNNSIFTKIRFFYIKKFGLDWIVYIILTAVIIFVILSLLYLIFMCIIDKKNAKTRKPANNTEKAKEE